MALTFKQKEWRRAARAWAKDCIARIQHELSRPLPPGTKTLQQVSSGACAKMAAHAAFQAHPELRD